MFTGLVEEIGTILRIEHGVSSAVLHIKAHTVMQDLKVGDSVAVNGVCLTATSIHAAGFSADVMHETLNRSSLAGLKPGAHVNLERAMAANGRFGGHIVSGHVDGTGKIENIQRDDNAIWYTIGATPQVLRYIVEKGSITIDGISLTVAGVDETSFAISAIPHTVAVTILAEKKIGDIVNLENDIVGKYVEKLMGLSKNTPAYQGQQAQRQQWPGQSERPVPKSKITEEFLIEYGF